MRYRTFVNKCVVRFIFYIWNAKLNVKVKLLPAIIRRLIKEVVSPCWTLNDIFDCLGRGLALSYYYCILAAFYDWRRLITDLFELFYVQ
jgi:hypothetical protein